MLQLKLWLFKPGQHRSCSSLQVATVCSLAAVITWPPGPWSAALWLPLLSLKSKVPPQKKCPKCLGSHFGSLYHNQHKKRAPEVWPNRNRFAAIIHSPAGQTSLWDTTHPLLSSFHLLVLELPEAAHRPHLLQVSVERQPAQPKAVAAIANRLETLHLLHDGGHWDWRRDRRRQ